MNYQDLMDILQRRQLNYWAGVPVDANAPSIQDIVTAIQSQYSPTMYAPQIGGANRFVGGGQIGQTGQPSQFGPIEIMPQYGAIAQSLQPGFVPSSFDINVYKNVNPQTLSDVISTIGDGGGGYGTTTGNISVDDNGLASYSQVSPEAVQAIGIALSMMGVPFASTIASATKGSIAEALSNMGYNSAVAQNIATVAQSLGIDASDPANASAISSAIDSLSAFGPGTIKRHNWSKWNWRRRISS